MSSLMGISVIICTWNRAARLGDTLRSLQLQHGLGDMPVEFVVIDNNSSDDTRALVERLASDWQLGSLRYAFEPRQGKQFALNLGISISKYPILAFTDDDINFPSDWLLCVRECFGDESVLLAGGKTLIAWGPAGRPPWFADDMLAILAGIDLGDQYLSPPPPGYAPGGSNLIARRQLFSQVGMFSETHYRHMDYEFGTRCLSRGVKVVYDPSLVVYAPVDELCLTRRYFRRWSFKAGFARSGGMEAAGRRPNVPGWIYRQAVEDAIWLLCLSHWHPVSKVFSRELRLWRAWGTLSNAWHGWLRPGRHGQWVQHRSQKQKNLY